MTTASTATPTAQLTPPRSHRLRRMVGRDPLEPHRGASPLELLYDLTFVAAFAQAGNELAHLIAEGHIAAGVSAFAFIIISVCWAWISYSWFASAFDTDDWFHRILTMVQMVGVVILALGIAPVFASIDAGEAIDFRPLALGYVIMRSSMIVMWWRVARQDPTNRRTALVYIVFTAGAQVGWVILAVTRPENAVLLVGLIGLMWLIELLGPIAATWGRRAGEDEWHGTPWHAGHISERYGLLVIITLGEGILGTISAVAALVANTGWTMDAVLIIVAGVGLTFGLWWSYFISPSAEILGRHRNRKWAWSYGHILIFGSIAAVGAGLHVAAYAAECEAVIGNVGLVLAVAIPVFIFCIVYFTLYSVLFRAVDVFHLWLALGMIAFLVLSVVLAAAGVPVGWCLLAVTASPAVVVVGFETVGHRHVEADVEREGA